MYWTVRPVPFTVSEEQSGEDSGVTVITVEKEDMPQKGKILVTKTGEEFSSVQVSGDGVVDKDREPCGRREHLYACLRSNRAGRGGI